MSLYNLLFGQNRNSDILLAVLGIKEHDVPRFRDVYHNEDGSVITIHTRTGGGNREGYREQNAALTRLPGYMHDYDDEGDSTYANFDFKVPEEWRQDVVNMSDVLEHGLRPEFAKFIAKTFKREPTEADEEHKARNAEAAKLKSTRHFMANGHTFVPLDDYAMKAALECAEENGGSLRTAWGILPINIIVERNYVRYPNADFKNMDRADVNYDFNWSIDHDYWTRCQLLFADAYPAAMAEVASGVEKYKDRQIKRKPNPSPELVAANDQIADLQRQLKRAEAKLTSIRNAVV